MQTEEKDDRGYPRWKSVLVSFLPDGSDFKQYDLPKLETEELNGYWSQLVPVSDGFAGVASFSDKKDERGMAQTFVFYHLDAEGNEISTKDISEIAEGRDWFGFMGALADAEDRMYLFTDGGILVYSAEGEALFTLDTEWVSVQALTGEGKPLVAYYNGQGGYEIAEIDSEKKDFGKKYAPPGTRSVRALADGDETYLFYIVDEDTLYGYSAASESYEALFRFLDLDINGDQINGLYRIGDRTFASFPYAEDAGGQQLCTIREAPQGVPKIVLTLACYSPDYALKNAVVAFNKSDPTYRIDIQDYYQYRNDEEDYFSGISKLNTDLVSGHYPDLIDLSQLPGDTYAAKGLLADLGAMLDADPDLSRDDFLPCALKALEINGTLYSIAASMSPMCLVSTKDVLGDRTTLTPEDAAALMAVHPGASFVPDVTADNLLMMLAMFTMDDFIDPATGKCSFDSPEFRTLLEMAAKAPTEIDYANHEYVPDEERLRNGEALFAPMHLNGVTEYQRMKQALGDRLAVTGFPTSAGSGVVASFQTQLGICSKSPNLSGAWAFIKYLYSPIAIPEKPENYDDED